MKKHLLACLFVLAGAALASAASPSLKEARQRWLHGNYGEAREQYEALAKDAKLRPAATVGLSRALESEGEYDKALDAVESALKDAPKDAGLLARQAELLYRRGRWDEAEKAANAALDADKNQFLARWVRVCVYRDRGDMKKADAECKGFVRTYTQRDQNDDPIKDPEELVLVGLAGAENARWNNLPDQFTFILQDVYGDAIKYDKAYWPAEYQAGLLLLEKYNRPEALAAFDKALTINASAAEALAAKGTAALMQLRDQGSRTIGRAGAEHQSETARSAAPAGRRVPGHRRRGRRPQGAGAGPQGQSARRAHPRPHRRLSHSAAQEGRPGRADEGGGKVRLEAGLVLLRDGRTAGGAPLLRRGGDVLPQGGRAAAQRAGCAQQPRPALHAHGTRERRRAKRSIEPSRPIRSTSASPTCARCSATSKSTRR